MRRVALALLLLSGSPVLAADFGVSHDEGQLASRVSGTLYTESWRGMGRPRGVLVVVPGFKDHGHRYELLANALVPKGLYVYAYDPRGFGRSSGERGAVSKLEDSVADLAAFIAFVHAREPNRPLYLFGQGLGGTVALLYALAHPELPGLILSAPALGTDAGDLAQSIIRVRAKLSGDARVLELPGAKFSRDPLVVEQMGKDPLVDPRPLPASTAVALLDAYVRIEKTEETLAVPLLVLQGTADEIVSPAASYRLIKRARTQDRTLKPYEGFFHDLLHEPGHERVVMDLTLWLVNHLPAPRR